MLDHDLNPFDYEDDYDDEDFPDDGGQDDPEHLPLAAEATDREA